MPLAKRPSPSTAASPPARPRVCIIGAGCAGLVSLKVLGQAGISCQAFELGRDVGGLWDQNNTNGRSAAYNSLRINTSRRMMEFSDFPMDERWGDYPSHHQVAEYFRNYAAHFALKRSIHFETEVSRAEPLAGGGYRVSLRSRSGEHSDADFDAIVVANGHHFSPAFPDPFPPGAFMGNQLHSHDYKSPEAPLSLKGKRVVVVGMGNSAMDIASELATSGCAERVILSYRRGVWVIPRYLFGRPIDQGTLIPRFLPNRLRRKLVTLAFQQFVGKMSDFGLPEPDHLIGEAHPTLSAELPQLVREGRVSVRPQIIEANGQQVRFADGDAATVDAIIYCTGYSVTFPFFDAAHIRAENNVLPLFLRIFHPEHRHTFFVGLAQPHGAIMPIAERQAHLLAAHLLGDYNLPSPEELAAELDKEAVRLSRRYVTSRRHTMQIDPEDYVAQLRREERRGRKRALRGAGLRFPEASKGGLDEPRA